MDVKFLKSCRNKWLGIYVNGNVVYAGDGIDPIELLELSEMHNFKSKDIKVRCLTIEDRFKCEKHGGYPSHISGLRGDYE